MMASPTRAAVDNFGSFGVSLFIFDRSALKEESDKIEDAVKYYYPREDFRLEKVKERCRQLVGMSDCVMHLSGTRPQVFRLAREKYALKQEGDYGIALAGKTTEADSDIVNKLDRLYDVFVFYHGSLHHVLKQMEGDDNCFTDRLSFIWSRYYNPREEKQSSSQRVMHSIFRPLAYLDLSKTGCQFFVRVSQILQTCQRQKGVLAGCVLYNKDILYTQVSPALTEKLLVCAARASAERASNPIRTGFPLPDFIQLYSLYLTADEHQQLLQYQPGSTRELLSQLIPALDGDTSPLLQPPVYASQLSCEEKVRTKSASSIGSSSSISPSITSRFSLTRSISPEMWTKQHPHMVQATSPRSHSTRRSLQHNLTGMGKKRITVTETAETARGVSVKQEQEVNVRQGMQCKMARTNVSKDITPTAASMPHCESVSVEMHCDGLEPRQGPSESTAMAASPPSSSQANFDGPICTENLNGQPDINLRMKKDDRQKGCGAICPNSHGVSLPTQPPLSSYDSKKTQSSDRRSSLPNTSLGPTADNTVFPSSLQSSIDRMASFDPTLVSACSSYGSLASTEEHAERADVARPLSSGSGDSVYLDCRPSQDNSTSPTQAAVADSTLLREITFIPEIKTACKETGNKTKQETATLANGGKEDSATVEDMLLVAGSEAMENRLSRVRLDSPGVVDLRKESEFPGGSQVASPFSDTTVDVSDFIGKEGEEVDEVEGMLRATLYIQAPEHSNLMLLLVAESQLERDEKAVHCLWEGSLLQLADLAVNLKECLSFPTPLKPVTSFYYASYNSYEKTLNTNCLQVTSRNAKSFVHVTKAMQKQHKANPDITDIVLRYPARCSAYSRFSLGKEIYFEPRVVQPTRLIAPPGSPDLRDIYAANEAVGFNIETTARTKLTSEARVNLL